MSAATSKPRGDADQAIGAEILCRLIEGADKTQISPLSMAKRPDPGQRVRQWLSRRRVRPAFHHPGPKPRLTPENARRDHRQMLRYLALHTLIGALIGATAALAIILLDIGGLRSLISHARHPLIPSLLVIVPFASLFGGAAAASAILTLPYDAKFRDDDDDQNQPAER